MRKLLAAVFGIFLAAAPAGAQDKPVDVNFGFGWTFPQGAVADSFDSGWNGNFGVTFNISPSVGLQAEYMYQRMNGPEKTIIVSPVPGGPGSAQLLESNQQAHAFLGNVVFGNLHQGKAVSAYGITGLGLYHRTVQITSPAVGFTTFCDPYWYVCYPVAVSVDNILGDRSSDDFGINFGGGIAFGHEAKFYIEARYHYVWGPKITPPNNIPLPTGTPTSTNASYFPLTFGVRF